MSTVASAVPTDRSTVLILSDDQLCRLRETIAGAIMAKQELDLLETNVRQAAASDAKASLLIHAEMMPRPVDVDCYDAAQLLLLLDTQQRDA